MRRSSHQKPKWQGPITIAQAAFSRHIACMKRHPGRQLRYFTRHVKRWTLRAGWKLDRWLLQEFCWKCAKNTHASASPREVFIGERIELDVHIEQSQRTIHKAVNRIERALLQHSHGDWINGLRELDDLLMTEAIHKESLIYAFLGTGHCMDPFTQEALRTYRSTLHELLRLSHLLVDQHTALTYPGFAYDSGFARDFRRLKTELARFFCDERLLAVYLYREARYQ